MESDVVMATPCFPYKETVISCGWQRTCCTESEEATAKDRGIRGRGGGRGGGKGSFIVSFRNGGEIESDGREEEGSGDMLSAS